MIRSGANRNQVLEYKITCLLALSCGLLQLGGCAGTPPIRADEVVFKSNPTIPATFDLDITPIVDGNYMANGKPATLSQIYWMIRGSRHSDKAVNTLLYHNTSGTAMQSLCVISVVYDWRIGGYQELKGVIRPMEVTGSSEGFQIFYKECMSSIGESQE